MTHKVDTLIIGGGPSGLGAAIALQNQGKLLEQSPEIGGFSGSIELAGAVMDYGGHSFHTPHASVKKLVFDSLDMYEQERNAQCFHSGQFIPYPFQQNFRHLTSENVIDECEVGLRTLPQQKAKNFKEHIENSFGSGISKHFMLPYNQKLWGADLTRLSAEWTGERVAAAYKGTKSNMSNGKRKPLQARSTVAYPSRGGFIEIFKALARPLKTIEFGASVERIDVNKRILWTSEGSSYTYEKLISTIPITKLLPLLTFRETQLTDSVAKLQALGLYLVFVVVEGKVNTPIQRIYNAESHILAHKTVINHNSSDYLRAKSRHGIVAEISDAKPLDTSSPTLERKVISNLIEMGIIRSASQVVKTHRTYVPFGYPVPSHTRDEIIQAVKDWLRPFDIYTVGRFGEWAYINSDEALFKGLKLGSELKR